MGVVLEEVVEAADPREGGCQRRGTEEEIPLLALVCTKGLSQIKM
jgi:hypothetical protein